MKKSTYILSSTILLSLLLAYLYHHFFISNPELSGLFGNLLAGTMAAIIGEIIYFIYKKTNGRK